MYQYGGIFMKLTNLTTADLIFKEIERGIQLDIYERRQKQQQILKASDILYLIDTDGAILSANKGDIKKHLDDANLELVVGLISSDEAPYVLPTGDFKVCVDGGADQAFSLGTGSKTVAQVVSIINATASGFQAEEWQDKLGLYATGSTGEIQIKDGSDNKYLGFFDNQKTKDF